MDIRAGQSEDCTRLRPLRTINSVCSNRLQENDQSIILLIETLSCNHQFFSELITILKRDYFHMVSQKTIFTYPFHHAKLQILLI